MPATDRRSVGELLAEADELARQTLIDVSADAAPAMLRTWAEMVEAAADLWESLPPRPTKAGRDPSLGSADPMVRLHARATSLHRSRLVQRWPGDGPSDERLLQIAEDLTGATALIERFGCDVRPVRDDARADLAAARMRIMHTVYVATHGVVVALRAHVDDLSRAAAQPGRRNRPAGVAAAETMMKRLDGFEQLAGSYLGTRYGPVIAGEIPPQPNPTRLQSALTGWDIHAHRVLAGGHEPANLVRIARTQALITTATAVVVDAALHGGHLDPVMGPVVERLDAAQLDWSQTAGRWVELVPASGRTDPALIRAAGEVRAAIAAVAYDKTGWAGPDLIASRTDLDRLLGDLHTATVAAVDVAYLNSEIARTEPNLRAPARTIAARTRSEHEQALQRGESVDVQAPWITPLELRTNKLIPLPPPARDGLIDLCDRLVNHADQAAAATARLGRTRSDDRAKPKNPKRRTRHVAPKPMRKPAAPAPGL